MARKRGNKFEKLQVHLIAVLENVKEKSVKLSHHGRTPKLFRKKSLQRAKFEKMMFSSLAIFIFVIFASLIV